MDIDSPSRPFGSSSSQANTLHFGTNTPFIFHSAPRGPQYEPYDPTKWASKDFKFGFGQTSSAEDVEMRFGDSPSRPAASKEDTTVEDDGSEGAKPGKGKGKGKKQFEVGLGQSGEGEGERKIASGAMTRVRRKRQQEQRRRRGSETDDDGDEVGHGLGPHPSVHEMLMI